MNSMAMNKNGDLLYDPHKGLEDIKNKIIRHTSSSFEEDPLRILRVARFAALFPDFTVAHETMALMNHMVKRGDILYLSKERIILEIQKVFHAQKISIFFLLLNQLNVFDYLLQPYKRLSLIPEKVDQLRTYIDEYDLFIPLLSYIAEDYKQVVIKEMPFNKEIVKISYLINSYYPVLHDLHLENSQSLYDFMNKIGGIKGTKYFKQFLKGAEGLEKTLSYSNHNNITDKLYKCHSFLSLIPYQSIIPESYKNTKEYGKLLKELYIAKIKEYFQDNL
jgi:tRNA nucleotidyltransferase/poly(A) polymerase